MNQTGYGFLIAATPAVDGRTLMVASQYVRDVDIQQNHTVDDNPWNHRGDMVRSETKIIASLASHGQRQHMVHLNVEQGGYAEAWRRLFDLWVPPQFTDETRAQILTHYIFG